MSPDDGVSSASSNRMNVDLPEPDGPIRKTNSPLSILTETLSSAGRADDLYCLDTWSRVIITARQSSGDGRATAATRAPAPPVPTRERATWPVSATASPVRSAAATGQDHQGR